jgi:hypothetical protein
MAKEEMLCPFNGRLCRECALYRGRHYFLCFSKKYRGSLEPEGESRRNRSTAAESDPVEPVWAPAKMPSAVDPFKRPQADIFEKSVNETSRP